MAARAFVLIETVIGKSREVVSILKEQEGVESVDLVTGPYDVIAIIEGEGFTQIGDLVANKINTIAYIFRTVTCVAQPFSTRWLSRSLK